MSLKTTITLLLGLVFQLAQVLPGAVVTTLCPSHAESCECCKTAKSCHCAKSGESDQKPVPAPLNSGGELKVPVMKSTETRVSVEVSRETAPSVAFAAALQSEPARGYAGVRLSVAFCSFVI
jgi:hypothetical protein